MERQACRSTRLVFPGKAVLGSTVLPGEGMWQGAPLLGFEVPPCNSAAVADVPETIDLCGVRTGCNVQIAHVDAINRDARGIPRVDVTAQAGRLPAERPGAVKAEWCSDGGRHRAACAGSCRSCDRRRGARPGGAGARRGSRNGGGHGQGGRGRCGAGPGRGGEIGRAHV